MAGDQLEDSRPLGAGGGRARVSGSGAERITHCPHTAGQLFVMGDTER